MAETWSLQYTFDLTSYHSSYKSTAFHTATKNLPSDDYAVQSGAQGHFKNAYEFLTLDMLNCFLKITKDIVIFWIVSWIWLDPSGWN